MATCKICGGEFQCLCLPRTRKAIRERIRQALLLDPALSSNNLAKQLGTTDKTVQAVKREMVSNSEIPNCPTRCTDGRFWSIKSVDERPEGEFYTTPPRAVKDLLARIRLSGLTWEPCCGNGEIARLLPGEVLATDKYDRGYGKGGVDFFKAYHEVDNIVTNPPFSLAVEWALHAFTLARKYVCLLLPLYVLEGVARRDKLFRLYPPQRILVFSRRLTFRAEGKDLPKGIPMAWYVWKRGFKGRPSLEWV